MGVTQLQRQGQEKKGLAQGEKPAYEDDELLARVPKSLFWCKHLVVHRLRSEIRRYDGFYKGLNDFFGDRPCSYLFLIFGGAMSRHITTAPEALAWLKRNAIHRIVNSVVRRVGSLFLANPQRIIRIDNTKNKQDGEDNTPCIWVANHRFKDEVLATILAAKRHAYIFIGSLPAMMNTVDGYLAVANGVIACNRKVKASRIDAMKKAILTLRSGSDIIIFPEGVWNKTPEKLLLPFFPGVYKIAKETGTRVIPVIHYMPNLLASGKKYPFYTVVEEPVSIHQMEEQEALETLRDIMATRYFELMEAYGQSSRKKEIGRFETAKEAWDHIMTLHTSKVKYYDKEIELAADYRPKLFPHPETVWHAIGDNEGKTKESVIQGIAAKQIIATEREYDYQRRF